MKIDWLVISAALALSGAAPAQNGALPKSTTPEATIVRSAEIEAAVERNNSGALSDSVLRVVPIESKYNVGVAVVRRSQVDGRAPPDALVHDAVTEVYQIIEGNGVLVTGGTLRSAKPLVDRLQSCARSARVCKARPSLAGHGTGLARATSSSSLRILHMGLWGSAPNGSSTRLFGSIQSGFLNYAARRVDGAMIAA